MALHTVRKDTSRLTPYHNPIEVDKGDTRTIVTSAEKAAMQARAGVRMVVEIERL